MAALWGPGLTFWGMLHGGNAVPASWAVSLAIWLAWIWLALLAAAAVLVRWRAVWVALPAPLVLYWPAMWIFVAHACNPLGACGSFFGLVSRAP